MKKWLVVFVLFILILIAIPSSYYFYLVSVSKPNITNPLPDHYHFRIQIFVDGKAVNFATEKFQTPYSSGLCKNGLTNEPIHFHDNQDQLAHIHWTAITGGQFLKYYGWNYIGGEADSLGYKINNFWKVQPDVTRVPIHGNVLPSVSKDETLWIYSGDSSSFVERSWNDWVMKDINDFFGKKSVLRTEREKTTLLNLQKAYAHNGEDDGDGDPNATRSTNPIDPTTGKPFTDLELNEINELVGNVVIFAQSQKPTFDQVKVKFNNLVPLKASVCGG